MNKLIEFFIVIVLTVVAVKVLEVLIVIAVHWRWILD